MRILVVEDELKMAGLLHRGLTEDGNAVDVARTGDDAVWMAGGRVRRDRPRPDAPWDRRRRGLSPLASERHVGPGAHAHRSRCGRGRVAGLDAAPTITSRSRSRSRSSRLVSARSFAAGVPNAPSFSGSATFVSTRRRTRCGEVRPRSSSPGRSSRCSRRSCGDRVTCCRVSDSSSTRGTSRTRAARTSSTSTFGTSGRRSIARSRARRSRRCAALDIAFGRTESVNRLPIRIRLALVFAVVMAVVLAALGAFLYVRLGSSLDGQSQKTSRAGALLSRQSTVGNVDPSLLVGEDGVAQVIGSDGRRCKTRAEREHASSPRSSSPRHDGGR